MRRPLFVAGLAAFSTLFFCMTLSKTALLVLGGAVFLSAAAAVLSRCRDLIRPAVTAAAVFAVCAALFTAHMELRVLPSETLYGKSASVEGVLVRYPAATENSVCCTLRDCTVNGAPTKLTIRVYTAEAPDAAPGDTLRFPSARFFSGEKDGVFYYHTLSTGAWLSAYGRQPRVTRVCEKPSPRDKIEILRHKTEQKFYDALPELSAQIAAALFTGESGGLPAEFKTRLRVAGASHIFAVSGMHLSLWTGVLFLLLRRRAKTKRWANAAASVFVIFYIFFTGCSPSVLRAGIMLLAAFLGRGLRRHSDPLNALGLAALALLLPDPFLAGNVSFLLSFLATAAIFTLYPRLALRARGGKDARAFLLRRTLGIPNGLLLSFCVLFFTVPVSAVFFGGVSLLSPVSSVLGAPPAEGVMLTAGAGLLFSFLPPVSRFFFRLCGACCAVVAGLTKLLSAWDFALCPVRAPDVALWYAGTLFAALAAYFLFRKNSRAVLCSLALSAALALQLGGLGALLNRDRVELWLPPAGNATAAAVVFGGSTAALIGTGGTYEGAAETEAFLSRYGVLSVKTLIVPDEAKPEAGQLGYIARRYAPKNVFSASAAVPVPPETELCAPSFSVTFRAGVTYENLSADGYTAGVLTADGIVAVFCYSPSADLSSAPARLRQGSLLVCRGNLPRGIDPADFGRICVMTEKTAAALRLPENAVTTGEEGGAVIRLK